MSSIHDLDGSNSAKIALMSIASSSQTPHGAFSSLPAENMGDNEALRPNGVEVEEQVTPRKSSPQDGLLPPLMSTMLLIYPLLRGNANNFVHGGGHPQESPLTHGQLGVPWVPPYAMRDEEHTTVSRSFMTPDASPIIPRRVGRSQKETTSTAETSLSVLSSPFTPRPSSQVESRSNANAAQSEPRTLSPPLSRDITPFSTLSSPFMDRLSLADRLSSKDRIVASPATPPNNPESPTPMQVDEDSSIQPRMVKSSPPLSVPIPQRATGGEIQRIRLQMAAEQAARVNETEAKRPDYLVREKRLRSDTDPVASDELGMEDQESTLPGLGVTVSPVKGRRLKLFQETSEESFEQSLLAGGYPGYGSTTAPEPQTPDNKGTNGLSQRAMQWLQQATPGQPGSSSMNSEPDIEPVPTEKELRKRKRLAAFEYRSEISGPPPKLHPVEIEGRGRVLLDVPPEQVPPQIETPVKKSRNNRRKRRGGHAQSASKRGLGDLHADDAEVKGPNWLDSAFPWCTRSQERTEVARQEQEERLKYIARYLERGSDSEEDIIEDQTLQPVVQSHDDDYDEYEKPKRRGRGKMVPLKANPDVRKGAQGQKSVLLPSDPADARAALLSKRSVRALAFRRREDLEREEEGESGEDVCICGGGEDGRPLVQCDGCHTWYHMECVGIKSPAELGAEDDPWFCPDCAVGPSSPPSEPTFAPTDDKPPADAIRDPLFYQGSWQESPSTPWSSARDPKTPLRGRDLSHTFSSRSSWGDSSRMGPSTPQSSAQNVRVYTTPGPFDNLDHFDSPFDPLNTPSRGTKIGGPFTTPKNNLWSGRNGGLGSRPGSDAWRLSGGLPFGNFDRYNNLPTSPLRNIYSYDDTPIRRSVPKESSRDLAGKVLYISPPDRLVRPAMLLGYDKEMNASAAQEQETP